MALDNRKMVDRVFEEIWNQKNIDSADELMGSNYVHHDPSSPEVTSGIEGYKNVVRYYLSAFPDLHFTVEDHVSDGHRIASRWTATGTHGGELLGMPATGKHFTVTGITIAIVQDGRFVESWNNWDALGLMRQLGAVSGSMEAPGRAA
jgi:steroid delta-isomerase-like uncharacterized protein